MCHCSQNQILFKDEHTTRAAAKIKKYLASNCDVRRKEDDFCLKDEVPTSQSLLHPLGSYPLHSFY